MADLIGADMEKIPQSECIWYGCDAWSKTRGYCQVHYSRSRTGSNMDAPIVPRSPNGTWGECEIPGCSNRSHSRGLCSGHYHRQRDGREMAPTIKVIFRLNDCSIIDCSRPHHAYGMCGKHYQRCHRYGISSVQLDMLYRGGKCEICDIDLATDEGHIDHDHSCCDDKKSCGRCIRGLLCDKCNKGMGMFSDNAINILKAYEYLERSKLSPVALEVAP